MFMFINYPWRENEKKTEVAMTCWWQKELAERDVTEREDRMKWEREMVMRRREEWGKICLIHSMTNIAKVVMEDVKILWTLFIFLVFVCVLLFLLVGEAFYYGSTFLCEIYMLCYGHESWSCGGCEHVKFFFLFWVFFHFMFVKGFSLIAILLLL
jgi:hypothetical protein